MQGQITFSNFSYAWRINDLIGCHNLIVSGIEMFHKTLDEACAGDQMGILLRGVKKDDVRRGMAVAKPGTIKQYDHFEAQVK